MASTLNTKVIKAPLEKVFSAFATAEALEEWLAPDGMTGKVHIFDFRPGGGYEMSLYYNQKQQEFEGKTNENEDRFTAKFTEIIPNEKIVQLTEFESGNEDFEGKMIMEVDFKTKGNDTVIAMAFKNIPQGIKPEDNEEGTRQSLEKLARYVELKS